MEGQRKNDDGKKRLRDDPENDSPDPKRSPVGVFRPAPGEANRDPVDSGVDGLMDILDDATVSGWGWEPAIRDQDLDSVIRSFEEEIPAPVSFPAPPPMDPAPGSAEAAPPLGYLMEASDSALGLPPQFSEEGEAMLVAEMFSGFDEVVQWCDDEAAVFAEGGEAEGRRHDDGGGAEFGAVEGLFDYGVSEWASELNSLPAI